MRPTHRFCDHCPLRLAKICQWRGKNGIIDIFIENTEQNQMKQKSINLWHGWKRIILSNYITLRRIKTNHSSGNTDTPVLLVHVAMYVLVRLVFTLVCVCKMVAQICVWVSSDATQAKPVYKYGVGTSPLLKNRERVNSKTRVSVAFGFAISIIGGVALLSVAVAFFQHILSFARVHFSIYVTLSLI